MKESRAWEQFRIMLDPSNNDEVFSIAYCCVSKACIYKKKVSGKERSFKVMFACSHKSL